MAGSLGALIGPLFDSQTPAAEDKKRAVKPKSARVKHGGTKSKVTDGEGSVTEPAQQHGELAAAAEPTPVERTHSHARDAKVRATQDWVEGRITSKEHKHVHDRANHVLMNRHPKVFRGTTGEKAPPKGRRGIW
jgi:hypothetical protein